MPRARRFCVRERRTGQGHKLAPVGSQARELASDRGVANRAPVNDQAPIYLLDISFFVFRAYHALPPLNTEAGVPTNAVHGVSTMVEKLLRAEKARFIGACFDSPARNTLRRERYPDYKANRLEPDEELRVQFPLVRRLVRAMTIPSLEVERYEADDILATLARRFAAQGRRVVLVTGDKDLMQCVDDHVSLYDPVRDQRVGREQVVEKFGVGPEGVADVLGLMGDSSDNIPGIKGVGPKTAMALIAHFGSIDAMYERLDEIETLGIRGAASVRRKIEDGREMALLCRDLATVFYDAPVEVALEDLELRSLVTPELSELATELEMTRVVERMRTLGRDLGLADADTAAKPRPRVSTAGAAATVVTGAVAAGDWSELAGPRVYVAVAADRAALGDGRRVALMVDREETARALRGLRARGVSLVGCDLKGVRRELGVDPGGEGLDLGLASYLIDPSAGDHGPADLCARFLGEEPASVDAMADVAAAQAVLGQLGRLAEAIEPELAAREQKALYRELELPLLVILGDMEARGIALDVAALAGISTELEERMQALVGQIYEAAGQEFNILSPLQLRGILFDKLGLPSKGLKQTKTGPSTDSDSLEALADAHPLPRLVLDYRGLSKLKSTYVDALPRTVDDDGRIHTRLNQTVAATGRLSSSDPNLQNIPVRTEDGARIRACFVAGRGRRLVSADYNQIELRVLAHLCQDANLIDAFRRGLDIHTATYAEVFEVDPAEVSPAQRREAKVINYGIVYGMGAVRLSRELGISRPRAAGYIERYFERYPGVGAFYESKLAEARTHGYVSTMFGRRRYLPDITSDHGGLRQAAERVATNTPIQGSAADIIKRAMVALDRALRSRELATTLILQIHDELLLEAPTGEVDEARELVREVMEGAAELDVPILVDVGVGHNWAEAH